MNRSFALAYIHKLLDDYRKSFVRFGYNFVNKDYFISFASPRKLLRPHVQIAMSGDFLNLVAHFVKEYDFFEAVISVHHECYHVKQYVVDDKCNMFDELESYVSRYDNNGVYVDEYDKFLHEIAAERYALHTTYATLKPVFKKDTDAILLDYVNARMCTDGAPFYFIKISHYSVLTSISPFVIMILIIIINFY